MVETWVVNRICEMYSVRRPLKEICAEVDLSLGTVLRLLRECRRRGDVRLVMRRLPKDARLEQVVGLLRCGEVVRVEEIAEVLWHDEWPGSWRAVVSNLVSQARKTGLVVRWTKRGYVLA